MISSQLFLLCYELIYLTDAKWIWCTTARNDFKLSCNIESFVSEAKNICDVLFLYLLDVVNLVRSCFLIYSHNILSMFDMIHHGNCIVDHVITIICLVNFCSGLRELDLKWDCIYIYICMCAQDSVRSVDHIRSRKSKW